MRKFNVVLTASILLFGAAAWGQGVGGSSPIETQYNLQTMPQLPEDPLLLGAMIGTTQSPIPIELDSNGPAWLTQFVAPGILSPRGSRVYIWESLRIAGAEPWSGWHVKVDSSELHWMLIDDVMSIKGTTMLRVNDAAPPGFNVEVSGEWLHFFFDPLAPGTTVEILLDLSYMGPNPVPTFSLMQFPVPEPVTMLIIGVSAGVLVARRRL